MIGIIGLILPVMPGWVFVIPGLIILSDYLPPVKRLVEWVKRKIPESVWKRPPRDTPHP